MKNGKYKISVTYYLYIYSSLKDSCVHGDILFPAYHDGVYTASLKKFIANLSRKTSRESLPFRYKILEGVAGSPTELRIILRCPPDWTPARFQEEALKEWSKNASVEEVLSSHTARSADMDLNFLTKAWNGSQNAQ
jgi:hypothetical protein